MSPALGGRAPISDEATLLALARLTESRQRLGDWADQKRALRGSRGHEGIGFGSFQPRSKTLQTLVSLALPRLPWIRWGITLAPLLLRYWRRR